MATEGGVSGLDLYRQSSTTDEAPEPLPDRTGGRCPNRLGWALLNMTTGEMVPARCARNGCAYCLPLNARRRALAVAATEPRRTITLTQLAEAGDEDPWPSCRRRYNRVREYLRRRGVEPGAWAVFIERGEQTGMVHGHVVQYGERPIPKGVLQEAAHRAGAGWTRIEAVRDTGSLTRYVGKGFGLSWYGVKGFDGDHGDPLAALALNGGRLGHFSRGYFRDEDGGSIGVREAERAALVSMRDPDEAARWVLMREDTSSCPA